MAYCSRCSRYFVNDSALEQHKNDSSKHWICFDCVRDFGSQEARRQHYMNSANHNYCDDCDEDFNDDDDLVNHYDELHYYCRKCDRVSCSTRQSDL